MKKIILILILILICILFIATGCGNKEIEIKNATVSFYKIDRFIENISTYNFGTPINIIEQGSNCNCGSIISIIKNSKKNKTNKEYSFIERVQPNYLIKILFENQNIEYYYLWIMGEDILLLDIEETIEYEIVEESDKLELKSYILE